ncbi:MAG: PH domain-containing protein [bacterium]|nr:PH domain-containing protein [bacterium]MBU1916758.1 PH domain-containing protein [bacterium]
MSDKETTLWKDSPSQVDNLGTFILCGFTFWLIIPVFIALYKFLQTKCHSYELTTERLKITKGILSKREDMLELYRVKDISILKPFFLRIFKCANLVLNTSDKSTPIIIIPAIPEPEKVREMLRTHVETMRDRKGVREVDL